MSWNFLEIEKYLLLSPHQWLFLCYYMILYILVKVQDVKYQRKYPQMISFDWLANENYTSVSVLWLLPVWSLDL